MPRDAAPVVPRLGAGRVRRAGNEQLEAPGLVDFLAKLRRNTREFDAAGRVLRLKRYVSAVAGSAVLDAVLDALAVNTRVEVLYIQNFERGFTDAQLARLTQVLKLGRIWAVNVGENFSTTLDGWRDFCEALPDTNVQYMYASEHHFLRTELKTRMRDYIRANRVAQRTPHDPAVVRCVGNMWFNPKVAAAPSRGKTRGGGPEQAPAAAEQQRGGGSGARSRRARNESPPPERTVQRRPGKRTVVLTARAAAVAHASQPVAALTWGTHAPRGARSAVLKRRAASAGGHAAPSKRMRR